MPTNVRDPRTIITPDAFGISNELLGTPLARPSARFWAMLIDLAVVGLLTVMLGGVGLFIWGVVALFLIGAAFRETMGSRNRAVSMILRVSTGCLGVLILSTVVLVWLVAALSDEGDDGEGPANGQIRAELDDSRAADLSPVDVARLLTEGYTGARSLGSAETASEAEDAALRLLEGLEEVTLDEETRLEVLESVTPADAPWAEQADAIYRRALERWEASGEETGQGGATPSAESLADSAAVGAEVEGMADREVLVELARVLEADPGGDAAVRTRVLRRRALSILADDTLSALATRVRRAQAALAEEEARRRAAEEETRDGGNALVALLRDIWDQLGSAIGLWSFYFTALLTLFAGQTVGKRALGIRVVRLDGEAMTWWSSFERAGGYVAGLATGLLGFAQVFWDPNRQCIHDKIVGTVVVDDRAESVPGAWREAWAEGVGEDGPAGEKEEEP